MKNSLTMAITTLANLQTDSVYILHPLSVLTYSICIIWHMERRGEI